jgi:hypothetical protein
MAHLLVQNIAQQPALDPLDHHVKTAPLFAVKSLDHARVVKLLADFLFALEALDENGISFHLRVGQLDGHGSAGVLVGSFEERSHSAARNHRVQAVVIQCISGLQWVHVRTLKSRVRRNLLR